MTAADRGDAALAALALLEASVDGNRVNVAAARDSSDDGRLLLGMTQIASVLRHSLAVAWGDTDTDGVDELLRRMFLRLEAAS